METIRCFLALELPGRAQVALHRAGAELVASLPEGSARVVPAHLLHVTLAFLGNRDERERGLAIEQLQQAFAGENAYRLEAGELRRFASGGVMAATLGGIDLARLDAARTRLVQPLRDAGVLAREHPGPWRPHITIVRSRGRRTLPGPARHDMGALAFTAGHVALFESRPTPGGHDYTPLRAFTLHGVEG